nr:MAG: ORF1 [TTV-like mini virus]
MPWYWRRPYYRRHTWRRRPRRIFRRKYWRRRRRRYRRVRRFKRKLPFLPLKQWQPTQIRKLKIMGIMPLYITTHERVSNNLELYIDSIAPHLVPGGGGFSVQQYTLNGFYELFQKGRCWWTQSTKSWPLIRYLGCKLDLYRSEKSDYIFSYHRCYPMRATIETYQSCQPTILQLQKNHKMIRCKTHNYNRKPYKRLKIKPPAQMENKWFFQKDIAGTPLLMTQCCASSFDRWFASSQATSTTIGFKSLNPETFQLHNFRRPPTTGYIPRSGVYLWAVDNGEHEWKNIKFKDLIYLGNSNILQPGAKYETVNNWENYFSSDTHWGNIFYIKYLLQEVRILVSNKSPSELKSIYKDSPTKTVEGHFTLRDIPNVIDMRYNPLKDRGDQNEIFLVNIDNDNTPITIPTDPNLKTENLPLWIAMMGFIDFQKRQATVQKVDTNYMVVIHTKYIEPKNLSYIIPIDLDFFNQKSEYRDDLTEYDRTNWHPKTIYQYRSCNEIVACGPGTVKLPKSISAEAHLRFVFYFKLGTCSGETKDIKNPEDQPKFPTPNNLLRTNSLQSPETPIETFLYNFDWRRDFLTKKAADRIQEYCLSEIPSIKSTGLRILQTETSPESSQTSDQEEEEKQKETLQLLIQQHQLRQRELKRRLLQLLTNQLE